MRLALTLLAAAALAFPGCAAIDSLSKPSPPPVPPSAPAPPPRVEPMPPLRPQLTEAEERRLRDQATRQIADAERAIQAVRADALQPGEQETYAAIQGFLRQARQALAGRDYERAATLGRKAETLAQDLPRAGH